MWVRQPAGCDQGAEANCQPIPPGSSPVLPPAKPGQGDPEWRGWWVYLPPGYDPTRPYRVIFSGTSCGDGDWFNAGRDGLPYQGVDGDQAILVGLDYPTFSEVPGCEDFRDPQSNDLQFFPWLQAHIENELCVDTSREFFSEYGDEAVAAQINCVFPDRLRGFALIATGDPGPPGFPGTLPPCADKPTAAFFVNDIQDLDTVYGSAVASCRRLLAQNGCQGPDGGAPICDPLNGALTTPYLVPPSVHLPPMTTCSTFNGCPAEYPVVFCVTYNQDHSDGENWGAPSLFWDWMTRLDCPSGLLLQDDRCVSACSAPYQNCGVSCANVQSDFTNCGRCGNACPAEQICQAGQCACAAGGLACGTTCVYSGNCACPDPNTVCGDSCVDVMDNTNNCGSCGNVCDLDGAAPVCVNGKCTASP